MTAIWSITQYRGVDSAPRIGIMVGEVLHRAPTDWPTTALELFESWDRWSPILRALDTSTLAPATGVEILAPITYPRKLLCAGANYYDHAAEMGTARPDPGETPFFFLKPPTTTIIPTGTDIVVHDVRGAQLDWEIELAVVIADRCSELSPAEARAHIAGYAVSNDVSARGRFPRPNAVFPPFAWDWLQHKGFDGSNPLGPIVPAWLVPDPQNLHLRLTVNGVSKQDSSTANMVVGIDELVAAASWMVTLEPGDVIITGTPAGVAMPRQDFMKPGDTMVAEIEGLGRLENRIVSA